MNPAEQNEAEYLRMSEAANRLGCSTDLIRHADGKGVVHLKRIGVQRIVSLEDIKSLQANR
jgi:hypothetical protein